MLFSVLGALANFYNCYIFIHPFKIYFKEAKINKYFLFISLLPKWGVTELHNGRTIRSLRNRIDTKLRVKINYRQTSQQLEKFKFELSETK